MADPEDVPVKKPLRPVVKPTLNVKPPKVGARPKVVARPAPVAKPAPKVIHEHKVVEGDTLSGISLKYYGSAAKKFYMYIYDFNKDVIGDNPNLIRQGIVIKIPEKPEL